MQRGTKPIDRVVMVIIYITLPPFIPVATAVTNLDPKCPSGDSRHMLGCLFWKSPAVIHSSELRK